MATKKKNNSGKNDENFYESEHLQPFFQLGEERKVQQTEDDQKNFVKQPALTNENVQKFKRGFKWVAVFNFSFAYFVTCSARYNGCSLHTLMTLFIITFNFAIYTHFLDERTVHWLKNPNDTTDGLMLKILALANTTAALIYISMHTAQNFLPLLNDPTHNKHTQDLLLSLWSIISGVTADIITLFFLVISVCFGCLHLMFLMATIIQDAIRRRSFILIVLTLVVGVLWLLDSKQGGLITGGPKFMQAFLALNLVFSVPRRLPKFSESGFWRKFVFPFAGPLVYYRWQLNFAQNEISLLTVIGFTIFFSVPFYLFLYTYAPGGESAEEEEECHDEFHTDRLINLEPLSLVADLAVRARTMLYMVFVSIPLNIIFGNQKIEKHGGARKLFVHLLKVLLESVCFSVGMTLLLYRPEDMGRLESAGALLDFLTCADTMRTIINGTVAVILWRLLSYVISYFKCPLAPWIQDIMSSQTIPVMISMILFVFFLCFSMLAFSASFNAFASLVCADKDEGWFILLIKRQTFYATTSVATFFLYAHFDVASDSFTNHGQEEADNFYMFVASFAGVTLRPSREPYATILRPVIRTVIFFSMCFGVLAVFLQPAEGVPQANYKRSADGLSINIFHMALARDNITHEHVTDYQRSFNHSYSACSTRWGDDLTALDHAILARMAYMKPVSHLEPRYNQCLADHAKRIKDIEKNLGSVGLGNIDANAVLAATSPGMKCKRKPPEEILADQAMHDKELADMQDALTFFFPEKEYGKVQVTVDWNEHSLRKVGLATGRFNKYYRFDFPKEKHTVIAVQGTDPSDYRDVIVDFRLWFISILVDWSETLIFLMNLLPDRNRARLQWVIDQIVTKFTIDESRLDFFAPVVQYVHEVITTDQTNGHTYVTGNEACPKGKDCWTISVTGHSLGGGIASIAGATLGVSSVSFSGPGFFYSRYQFGTKVGNETLYPKLARAVNLNTVFMPSTDPVPRFDSHIGAIQHTACTLKDYAACHSISAMVCDLMLRCGDNQEQKRFHSCEDNEFEPTIDMGVLENTLY